MGNGTLSSRSYDLKRYNHLYLYEEPFGAGVCVYCGDSATTVDHIIPLSYIASLGDVLPENRRSLQRGLKTVPACRDCNNRLHSFVGFSITEKRKELRRRLRTRFAKLIGEYDWEDSELEKMGHSLSSYIRSQEMRRRHLLARLHFPDSSEPPRGQSWWY